MRIKDLKLLDHFYKTPQFLLRRGNLERGNIYEDRFGSYFGLSLTLTSAIILSFYMGYMFMDMHSFRNDIYKSYELPNELSVESNNIQIDSNILMPSVQMNWVNDDSNEKLKKQGIDITDQSGEIVYSKLKNYISIQITNRPRKEMEI